MMLGDMKLLWSVFVLYFYISQTDAQCSTTSPCTPLTGGQAFRTPEQTISVDGSLTTSLVVDVTSVQIDWLEVQRRLYNGSFTGPTIRIKAGDTLALDLINNLKEPDFTSAEINFFRFPNSTNLHTHGLHISSEVPQDNVFVNVGPEQTFSYRYEIDDQQPSGTYWYHAHRHGSGFFHVLGGMGGMIVVEDDPQIMPAELNDVSCPLNCDNDIQLVFQIFQYSSIEEDGDFAGLQRDMHDYEGFRFNNITVSNSTETLEEWLEDPANNINYFLVNGILQPKLTMQPGAMKRFRLLNAGGLTALALHVINTNSTGSQCQVKEIALDGIYLDVPRDIRLGRTFLVSASRVDWLIICDDAGTYQLRSDFMPEDERSLGGHPTFTGILATIEVTGAVVSGMTFPSTLPPLPEFLGDFQNVPDDQISGRFAIEVTPTDTINREDFKEDYIRYKAEVDTVQEWYFTNTEYETSHPIHIHINSFQVIGYNPYTGPYGVDDGESNWKLFDQNGTTCQWQHSNYDANAAITNPGTTVALNYLGHDTAQANTSATNTIGYAQIGEKRDTLLVPPLSNITVRFMTHKYTGDVVIHCHLIGDSDQGMMMTAEIVEKGANRDANLTSSGAYPGSCFNNEPLEGGGNGGNSVSFSGTSGYPVIFLSAISIKLVF